MDNKYQLKIEEVIAQALTEKTFSLEIIEKIKSLKDGFEANETLLVELKKSSELLRVQNEELQKKLTFTKDKLDSYISRENAIKTEESKYEKKQYELEFQTKRANEIKELMMIVFKNPLVRKSTYNNINDCGSSKSESGNITEEQE